jgi:hypothetical protein
MPFRHDVTAQRRTRRPTRPCGLVKGDICIRIAPVPSDLRCARVAARSAAPPAHGSVATIHGTGPILAALPGSPFPWLKPALPNTSSVDDVVALPLPPW